MENVETVLPTLSNIIHSIYNNTKAIKSFDSAT